MTLPGRIRLVARAQVLETTVLTAKVRHFEVWASLARASELDVAVTPFRPYHA